jgi:hypothetical protein
MIFGVMLKPLDGGKMTLVLNIFLFYFEIGQGPLPPAKKEYGNLVNWVDSHLTIFKN